MLHISSLPVSHFILLTGLLPESGSLIFLTRTLGYILVAVGLFALLQDILERQKAEEALSESEEHLNVTFEQTAVGIVEFFTNDQYQPV